MDILYTSPVLFSSLSPEDDVLDLSEAQTIKTVYGSAEYPSKEPDLILQYALHFIEGPPKSLTEVQ
jgi:hypothetical protein